MHCRRVQKLLAEYMDETLCISVEEQVRAHLGQCPRCAALEAELRGSVALLRGLPRLETSADFTRNLRRHLPVAVALSRRPTAPSGFLGGWGERLRGRHVHRASFLLAPVALVFSVTLYLWNDARVPVADRNPAEPVVTQSAYLDAVAREHAGYASEHPLMDTSAVHLTVTVASAKMGR